MSDIHCLNPVSYGCSTNSIQSTSFINYSRCKDGPIKMLLKFLHLDSLVTKKVEHISWCSPSYVLHMIQLSGPILLILLYRVFIKYSVFSLKFCDFLNSASSAAALVFYLPLCRPCTQRWKTETGQSPEFIWKFSKKHNI